MNECLNCLQLGHCSLVDATKLLDHFKCLSWEEVEPEIAAARATAIRQFGNAGVRTLIHPPKED
jgi:hypothetical protein